MASRAELFPNSLAVSQLLLRCWVCTTEAGLRSVRALLAVPLGNLKGSQLRTGCVEAVQSALTHAVPLHYSFSSKDA